MKAHASKNNPGTLGKLVRCMAQTFDRKYARQIPYVTTINDNTFVTKDGSMGQMIELDGSQPGYDSVDELMRSKDELAGLLKGLPYVTIHTTMTRERDPQLPDADSDNEFVRSYQERWTEQRESEHIYEQQNIMTVIRHPLSGLLSLSDKLRHAFFVLDDELAESKIQRAEHELNVIMSRIEHTFASRGARRLGTYSTDVGPVSEVLGHLSYLINLERHPVLDTDSYLANVLSENRIIFNHSMTELNSNVEMRGMNRRPGDSRYAALCTFAEYPPYTKAGILSALKNVQAQFMITQSYEYLDRVSALAQMDRWLKELKVMSKAAALVKRINEVRDALSDGETAWGTHNILITCYGDSVEEVEADMEKLKAALTKMGVGPQRLDLAIGAGFFSRLPGQESLANFPHRISSLNTAAIMLPHTEPRGVRRSSWGPHLESWPTWKRTLHHMDLFAGKNPHSVILAESGAGKTLLAEQIILASLKYGGPRFTIDKFNGWEPLIRILGGPYWNFIPGELTGVNPCHLIDTPANREHLAKWIFLLAEKSGMKELSLDDKKLVYRAVQANYETYQDPKDRRLGVLVNHLLPRSKEIGKCILQWCEGHEKGWMFDNPVDTLDFVGHQVAGCDVTHFLKDEELRVPMLAHLIHRLDSELITANKPSFITIEEGATLVGDDYFAPWIGEQFQTSRKLRNVLMFVSTAPEELHSINSTARTIMSTASNQFLFPNPKANKEFYMNVLGCTLREWELVRHDMPANFGRHQFLFRQDTRSVVLENGMENMPEYARILGAGGTEVALMRELQAKHGDVLARWLPEYMEELVHTGQTH